jgi:hypothetical protein
MYSGVGWGCCSDVLEAVMGASGAKTRYFLCFPILNTRSICIPEINRKSSAQAPAGVFIPEVDRKRSEASGISIPEINNREKGTAFGLQ